MPKRRPVTRRQLLVAAAPVLAAAPLAKLALGEAAAASAAGHAGMAMGPMGHAAMIGAEVPAPGGPNELDALLYPPKVLAHKPGRLREYTLVASDRPFVREVAGEAAWYVPENSGAALAEGIGKLLDDEAARERMGQVGAERIRTRLNWENSVEQLLQAYQTATESEQINR